ncbi:MAG: hypothetical protein PHE41_03010 [Eubacteriales bacterium]|nr:hypothetical protein [Eubacteriales bacterium]
MKKLISIVICALLLVGNMAISFATDNENYEINDVGTFKEILNEISDASEIEIDIEAFEPTPEHMQLLAITNPKVVNEFIEQKTEDAMNSLRNIEFSMDMDKGEFYREEAVDIGDNCWVVVKMGDFSTSPVPLNQSGFETGWVKYGSRVCWSEVSQIWMIGSGSVRMNTYYTASSNGITINNVDYSYAGYNATVSEVGGTTISPRSATSFGSTAISRQNFSITAGIPVPIQNTYMMIHNLKYLDKDYLNDEIHRSFSWEWKS